MPEDPSKVASRAWPELLQPPDLPKVVETCDASWPQGAPPRPIAIEQLFYPDVYARIKDLIRRMAADLADAESAARRERNSLS